MATLEEIVNTAYINSLGRPADAEGLAFYTDQLAQGRSLGDIVKDLDYAAATGVEDVEANRAAYETLPITLPTRTEDTTLPSATVTQPTTYAQPAPAETLLDRNPFYPTYTPRQDINYDELFTARSLDQGGTAPTAESINEAFETFYNRPADMPGIQGYLNSGKSIEQIRADLAYSALYSPELGLSKDVEYYEAPSEAQLGYIQSLGGGTPTSTIADTFSYTAADPLTAEQVRDIYINQFGYEPTQQDIDYWTTIYPMSPDVRMSANPQQQTINAMLVGSGLPEYQYLKTGTDLTGTQGVNYRGTPINAAQLNAQTYENYRTVPSFQTAGPFGGFFEEPGAPRFSPFSYTGIAPSPQLYTGYAPVPNPFGVSGDLRPEDIIPPAAAETSADQGTATAASE